TDWRGAAHRRDSSEPQAFHGDAEVMERVDAEITDVEGQQTATTGVDRQSEPRRARLFGVDADAGCRGPLQLLGRRGEQLEEPVRGDAQGDRALGCAARTCE